MSSKRSSGVEEVKRVLQPPDPSCLSSFLCLYLNFFPFHFLVLSCYRASPDLTIFSIAVKTKTRKHTAWNRKQLLGEMPQKARSVISPHLMLSVFVQQLSMLHWWSDTKCPDWHFYFNEQMNTHTHTDTDLETHFTGLLHLHPAWHAQREVRGWGLLERGWM